MSIYVCQYKEMYVTLLKRIQNDIVVAKLCTVVEGGHYPFCVSSSEACSYYYFDHLFFVTGLSRELA